MGNGSSSPRSPRGGGGGGKEGQAGAETFEGRVQIEGTLGIYKQAQAMGFGALSGTHFSQRFFQGIDDGRLIVRKAPMEKVEHKKKVKDYCIIPQAGGMMTTKYSHVISFMPKGMMERGAFGALGGAYDTFFLGFNNEAEMQAWRAFFVQHGAQEQAVAYVQGQPSVVVVQQPVVYQQQPVGYQQQPVGYQQPPPAGYQQQQQQAPPTVVYQQPYGHPAAGGSGAPPAIHVNDAKAPFCTACGVQNNAGTAFCGSCGHRMA